jgi:hypothetical protein
MADASGSRTARTQRIVLVGVVLALLAAGLGWLAGTRGKPAPETLLVVDTVPAGASVTVDGQAQRAPSPVALASLGAGKHSLKINLAGRAPIERVVELTAGQRQVLTLQLPPLNHPLHVETVPTGATALLDGKLQGITPITLQLSDEDFHELRLEKAGYESVKRGLPPDLKEPSLSVTLQTQTRAVAHLIVSADGPLPVFVDGLDSGFLAPTIALELLPGQHTVELRDFDGKVLAAQKVSVVSGETKRLHLVRPGNPNP